MSTSAPSVRPPKLQQQNALITGPTPTTPSLNPATDPNAAGQNQNAQLAQAASNSIQSGAKPVYVDTSPVEKGGPVKPPAPVEHGGPVKAPPGSINPAAPSSTPGAATGPPVVTTPGAPPGVPATTPPAYAIPPIATDEAAKQAAITAYNDAAAQGKQGLSTAAMNYGDPSLDGGVVNPNSALAVAALRAQNEGQSNYARMEDNNTVFSGINMRNVGQIQTAQQRADLLGYQKYQNALGKFNLLLQQASDDRDKAIAAANADEATAAATALPTSPTQTGTQTGSGKSVAAVKGSKVTVPKVSTKVTKVATTGKATAAKTAPKGSTAVKISPATNVKKVGKA